jgi:hypothetical protein
LSVGCLLLCRGKALVFSELDIGPVLEPISLMRNTLFGTVEVARGLGHPQNA